LKEHALAGVEIETEERCGLARGEPKVRRRLELFANPLNEFSKIHGFLHRSGADLPDMNSRYER
jgi:hypothetical protein